VDPSQDQWRAVSDAVKAKKHFPFFDSAYQVSMRGRFCGRSLPLPFLNGFVLVRVGAEGRVSAQAVQIETRLPSVT
jgi:hypothetical protein